MIALACAVAAVLVTLIVACGSLSRVVAANAEALRGVQ